MSTLSRIETLKSFLKDDPEDTFVLFALSKEYEKMGILKMALDTYIEVIAVDKNYVGVYYHLGKLYEELEENDNALDAYNQGITVAKKIADFHALSELHTAKVNLEIEM